MLRALVVQAAFALVVAAPASAQPAPVLDRVATAVAERWGVDPNDVVVEWSPAEAADGVPHGTPVRLVGGGADGTWYVDVETSAGTKRLRARAGMMASEVVAARDLERGVELTVADMTVRPAVRWGPPARESDGVEPGWVTRRRIAAGQALVSPAVARPLAVKPGDDVRIVYAHGPVELVLAGRAAGSAAVGERVAVRADTGKRLNGVVVSEGTIRIDNGAGARR